MAEQALKWWHVRWRPTARRLAPIAILICKVFVVLWLIAAIGYGGVYLLAPWMEARHLGKFDTRLNTVPAMVPNQMQAPLSETSFDHYGFKFLLPNRKIDRTHVGDGETLIFLAGKGLLIVRNTHALDTADLLPIVKKDKRVEQLLGQELAQSNTKLMQAALSATPGQVKWWRFRSARNMRQDLLLTLKFYTFIACSTVPDLSMKAPVYSTAFGAFRGIQCGDPNAPPYDAHIDVFDQSNRHFSLDVTGPTGHGQVITQEELNAMVASIRPNPNY